MSKQVPPRGEELTAADSPNDTARAQLLVTPEQAQLLAEHLKSLDDVLDYAAQLVPTNGQREATLVALAAIIDCLQTFHFTRPRIDLVRQF